jgi:hypothetical protein
VSFLALKLCESLSHDKLVFLGKGAHDNLLHTFDHQSVNVRLLIILHLVEKLMHHALPLKRRLFSLLLHIKQDLIFLNIFSSLFSRWSSILSGSTTQTESEAISGGNVFFSIVLLELIIIVFFPDDTVFSD